MANSWNHLYSPTVSTSLLTDSTTLNVFNTTATTVNAFGAALTTNISYGGTDNSTTNISSGTVASAKTKTINFGTGGASGSSTTINIGAALGTSKIYQQGSVIIGLNGHGHIPTDVSLAGLGIIWNKSGNGTGATYFQNYRQGGSGGFYFELYSTSGTSPTLLSTPLAIDGSGNSVFSGSLTSSSPSGGIGYTTGAGGTEIQSTSKFTDVTINKITGTITTNNAALADGASATFYVNNNMIAETDTVYASARYGVGNFYSVAAGIVSSGGFGIRLTNNSGASRSEAIQINFAIFKCATL